MTEIPMKAHSRPALWRTFGTLLALGLLIYLLSKQGWGEIWQAVQEIAFWRVALAMAVMMISRLAVTGRWYTLLRSAGIKITLGQTLQITFAGLFSSNFLPTTIGGDVIRLAGALRLKLDPAVSAASLIVDRLVGMAGMALALPFGLPSFLQANFPNLAFNGASLTLALGSVSAFQRLRQHSWWKKGVRIVKKLVEAVSLWLKQPGAVGLSLLFTGIHMLCLFGVLALLFDGMGEHVPFWLIGGLYSLVYFVTLMPISINGYGLQEISMTFVFSSLANVSVSSGLTAALLFRTLMMTASLPGAVFVPALLPGAKSETVEKAE
jgi:uncharacterized membrane protein YbhN (UPF0104 family)